MLGLLARFEQTWFARSSETYEAESKMYVGTLTRGSLFAVLASYLNGDELGDGEWQR